ncbi:PilW family protein [Methylophaga sp. OBS4]|uniref:PilW family protein n=1 Tax=Methylophaga sp. OBS4 TaxID=2991935 RepID=UPI00224FB5CB|nr:prepilin-type N-terminal cleavage/methylation domain-containing protein [Methylophaga sp. OBS4]MCX4187240.1 prepilin-type N-terminal cleavage/methylation domain-containing protein [Methylophaga sp. OBS4]
MDKSLKQSGLTLIELMIALVLALLVTGTILTIFISNVKSSSENIKMIQLNQELRAVIGFMSDELKRAGYSADPDAATFMDDLAVSAGCIRYSYDEDSDGIRDGNERFGFQLNSNAIRWANNITTADCSSGTWQPLTSDEINITAFDIQLTNTASGGGVLVNQLDISVTGERDLNPGTATRTFTETVRIRNDGT